MMAHQIEVLLCMWGRWAIRRHSKALGYPSTSPMFKDAPRTDGYGSSPPAGVGLGCEEADMEAVDAAVGRLPGVLRLCVLEMYQRGGSCREVASRCGVHHSTFMKYLAEAHAKISVDIREGFSQNRANSDSFHLCHLRKQAVAT